MLSYRHSFHAGNQADVLKHTVLIFCLDYLAQKTKPFLYADTHAGAGFYRLDGGIQNREWPRGIGKVKGGGPMIARYLEVLGEKPEGYTGSPLIAAALLRPDDRGCCFELHPADFAALRDRLAGDRRFQVRKEDGLEGLKSLLPPTPRRGLIFIDPSYELKEDYPRLIGALEDSLRRFAGGLYLIWYPLLTGPKGLDYGGDLMGLYGERRCRAELRFGLPEVRDPEDQKAHLYGCGLVLFNPPWTLRAALGETLPVLAETLGGDWEMNWEENVNKIIGKN
ncbi:MAG: 23S rRNA (adenine(2030)-N(6))-methyltransferase RlmJ [Treponema sp.]|jgi:23S rRNA (adenine2030-N6)-methyltransferase|nr:23S rRNA (adenine(2030)-N(6))-methyltransferase RlmJ [Treponema sp.]